MLRGRILARLLLVYPHINFQMQNFGSSAEGYSSTSPPPPQHLDQTDTMTSCESLFNQDTPEVTGNLNRLKHRLKT